MLLGHLSRGVLNRSSTGRPTSLSHVASLSTLEACVEPTTGKDKTMRAA